MILRIYVVIVTKSTGVVVREGVFLTIALDKLLKIRSISFNEVVNYLSSLKTES